MDPDAIQSRPTPAAATVPQTKVVVEQPAQAAPASAATPVILDGALVMVIVTSFFGLVKMSAPLFGGLLKSTTEAKLLAGSENRRAELDNEAATALTMRTLLERNSEAAIAMNKAATDALTGRVTGTLDLIVKSLSDISSQMDKVSESQQLLAETQRSISDTQFRTIQILVSVEAVLASKASGSKVQPPVPKRAAETEPSQLAQACTDLQSRTQSDAEV